MHLDIFNKTRPYDRFQNMIMSTNKDCLKVGCFRKPVIDGLCEFHYADVLLRKEKKDGKK